MSLNQLYRSLGISKPGAHYHINKYLKDGDMNEQVLKIIHHIRSKHPTMGIREMYFKIGPKGMGRDKFEKMCAEYDLLVKKKKNWRRTTDSRGVTRFDNLAKGLKVGSINQVWNSDITYFEINNKFYYITLIQDAFTKRIVGHSCSRSLITEQTTLPALKKAIRLRRRMNVNLAGLIFHSDGGGQYYDKAFRQLTKKYNLKNSMGKTCYENPMAESLNGVIKNKYLKHFNIKSFNQLKQQLDRVVELYNTDKPHSMLHRMTPIQYETKYLHLENKNNTKSKKMFKEKVIKHKDIEPLDKRSIVQLKTNNNNWNKPVTVL